MQLDSSASPPQPTIAQSAALDPLETRDNNFDFLRYLFACLVILFHAILFLHLPNTDDITWRYTRGQQDTGSLAVDGFFVISGYLITASWLRCHNLPEFVQRRFLRIYPGFAAAVLLTIFVVAPLGGATIPRFWFRLPTQDFVSVLWLQDVNDMLPNAFRHNPQRFFTNGALWTIRYEIVCYALVALLGAVTILRRRALVLVLFLASLLWHNHVWNTPYIWGMFSDFGRFPRLLCFFMAGMCAYLYRDRIRYTPWLLLPALGLLAVIPFVWPLGWHWALPFCFSYFVFYVAFSPRLKLHHWARNGDYSYGVYLYGTAVLQLSLYYFPHRWTPLPLGIFSCIAATGVAVLSWNWVEKPALKWKNRSLPPLPAFLKYKGTGIPKREKQTEPTSSSPEQ